MAQNKRSQLDLPEERDADRGRAKRQSPASGGSRLSWWASRLLVMLVLLAVLALFAPTFIAATGIWKSLLATFAPESAGQINASSLSLAWWSPIEIRGLSLRDREGQPLAEVPLVRSQKTLWELASDSHDLGVFEITQPRVSVVLRSGGSNIEDFLARLPQSKHEGGSSTPMRIGLVLTGGSIELDDTIAGRQWLVGDLALELNWPTAGDQSKSGKLAATVRPLSGPAVPAGQEAATNESPQGVAAPGQAASISAEFTWQPSAAKPPGLGAGQAEVKLSGLPTELLQGGLRRFVADIRPQGAVNLDAACAWNEDGKSQHLVVRQLAAPALIVAAPDYLGSDQLTAAIAVGQADILLAGDRLDIKSLRLDSNLVQVAGSGSAAISSLAPGGDRLAAAADGTDIDLRGQIDLAELARQLPATLRLRQGTDLVRGTIQCSLASRRDASGRQWQGSLKTDRIEATAAGRPIVLDQPLAIELAARLTDQGLLIDQLTGRASFLSLDGHGSLAGGTLTAEADLDKLVAELGRIIDWRDVRLTGTLGAQLGWSRGAADAWTAQADARVQNFVAAAAGMTPWHEQDLQIATDITGVVTAAGLEQISTLKLTVLSAGDRLEASLAEPVKQVSASAAWPLSFTLRGDLATWMPRVQPIVSLAGWEFAGLIDARGSGRFSAATCQLGPTHLDLQQLDIAGPTLWIREPQLKLDTAGVWDQEKLTLVLPETVVQSTSLGLRADDLRLALAAQPTLTGVVDFRGDAGQLSSWIGPKAAPRSWQVAGLITGRAEVTNRGGSPEASIVADVEKFQFLTPETAPQGPARAVVSHARAPGMAPRWSEAKVSWTAQAAYDPAGGKVTLARSDLKTDWAQVAATGTISDLAARCVADLSGTVSYDLALVEQKIKTDLFPRTAGDDSRQPRSIDTLVLRGQEKRPFTLRGPLLAQSGPAVPAGQASPIDARLRSSAGQTGATPLISDELVGQASLGWQAAQYVGLVAGPAEFKAELKQGTVFIGPLDIPVSEGRLTTAPRVLLNDPGMSLVVERGALIQNVQITPEMCNQWLKYVAPMLADATEAQGKFSLSLEGAAVPLLTPLATSAEGTLAIHGAQVGPGPLAKQYLQTARQLKALVDPAAAAGDNYGRWLVLPEHNVAFAVRDGIVSHRGLKMTAQNFVLTTEGHVRIEDQAIELDANIPIQDAWFKKKDQQGLLAKLRGQSIPIKVGGTLSRPKLDGQPLQAFGQQYVGTAVQGLLDKGQQKVQGLLEKEAGKVFGGLDGLLGPKPKPAAGSAPATPRPMPTP